MYKLIRQFRDKEVDVVVENGVIYLKTDALVKVLEFESARKKLNHFVIKENVGDLKMFEGSLYMRSDQAFMLSSNHAQFPLSKQFAIWLVETINVAKTIKPMGPENFTEYLNEEDKSKTLPKHYSTTEIAKLYGKSAQWLNEMLNKEGIIYKVTGKWVLYSIHENENKGYQVYLESEDKNWIHPYWTVEGYKFIIKVLARKGYYPLKMNKDNSEQLNLFDDKV